ncbi:putative ATP-dependent RNA helicase DDX11-like protein 8 [Nymphaea thermarum]|nr:putative ATP-dependent RNA helicase DDX11-like protein 8 [Nymphaea thermarum]
MAPEDGGGNGIQFPAFPFTPYSIQTEFMRALYDAIEKGGVAMLERTGKTLSIICSALQWVVDQRSRPSTNDGATARREGQASCGDPRDGDGDEPDWMRDFVPKIDDERTSVRQGQQSIQQRTKKSRDVKGIGEIDGSRRNLSGKGIKKKAEGLEDEELEFLVDEYDSGEEEGAMKRKAAGDASDTSSGDSDDEDEEEEAAMKVYFCSRTHSQLSQFVKELRRTVFDSELKAVCLGSRQNMCINADVLKLGSLNRINERCLELQKNKSKGKPKCRIKVKHNAKSNHAKPSSGCPMLSKRKLQKQYREEMFRMGALDIEDAVQLGHKINTCPYYGSRSMIRAADLVVLPYQSLLLKSSRESLGLSLRNSIIIIDEAHNLADSLTNMYNSKVTKSQLEHVGSTLRLYLERFQNRLGAGNRRYIQTIIIIVESFLQLLLGGKVIEFDDTSPVKGNDRMVKEKQFCDYSMAINDFLFSLDIDNINFVKLMEYIKESNIINKVSGFNSKMASSSEDSAANDAYKDGAVSIQSSFQAIATFLISLSSRDFEGRIIVSRQKLSCPEQQDEGFLKFVMLTGEKIFSEIMDEARAVVLAGGTLQPIEEMKERLFPCLPRERLHFFSCNHIVPSESILPIAVSCGPTGRTFDFSYHSRSSTDMIEELGRLICNILAVVPEGIIVFFPSFEYERKVYDAWKSAGLLERIQKRKQLFREPRGSVDVEAILKEYRDAVTACSNKGATTGALHNGALLLAVVGGKVSEGINFSDGLGRCVVMVGLPYPSPSDVELIERIKYIEGSGSSHYGTTGCSSSNGQMNIDNHRIRGYGRDTSLDILRSCKLRGREYYENLCMKAVNQSIGRAIRHIDDYAAILLVDSRYASKKGSSEPPVKKLPGWIKARLVSVTANFGEVYRLLHQFFKFNKQRVESRRCPQDLDRGA